MIHRIFGVTICALRHPEEYVLRERKTLDRESDFLDHLLSCFGDGTNWMPWYKRELIEGHVKNLFKRLDDMTEERDKYRDLYSRAVQQNADLAGNLDRVMRAKMPLKAGDKVQRNGRYYVPESDQGKIFTVASAPWNSCGTTVVELAGFENIGFAVDGLDKVEKEGKA